MLDCKHMETRCNCGAHGNSPDCKGMHVDLCALTECVCDYSGSFGDTQDCWRWQERDAADWRALAVGLGERLTYANKLLATHHGWAVGCEALDKLDAARKEEGK